MRSFPSGIEMFTTFGHDLALRRNLRRAYALRLNSDAPKYLVDIATFATSTLGSHHIRLLNAIHKQWNSLATIAQATRRPILRSAAVNEVFGLVPSEYNATFGGLFQMKEEMSEDDDEPARVLEKAARGELRSGLDPGTGTIAYLNIDPSLLDMPLPPSSSSQAGRATASVSRAPPSETPAPLSIAAPSPSIILEGPGLDRTTANLKAAVKDTHFSLATTVSTYAC